MYYHNSLPLKVIDIQFLNGYINFEIRIGGKLCSFLCLYRSPSQTRDIFETFADNFDLTLGTIINKNPFLIVALGGFNAKTTNWYKNDTNSHEGLKIDTITSQFGLQQLVNEPTHRGGSKDFEKSGSLCQPTWLVDKENFRFEMV